MKGRYSNAVAVVLLLTVLAGPVACGRRTDPLTPASPRPAAVTDVTIAVRDRVAYLSWPVPSKNVEDKPLGAADIVAFRIYRAELERDRKRPHYRERAEIDMTDPAPATVRDGTVQWSDPTLHYDRVYGYKIRAYSARGGVSPYSAEVRAVPVLSLAEPQRLTATAGDGKVTLTWNPVTLRTDGTLHQGFIGYNIYRSRERGRAGDQPLNAEPIKTSAYADTTAENGEIYHYRVRAVDSPVPPGKESLDSDEVSAGPTDQTPPAAPSGVTVVPGVGRVFLTWNENKERDLAGYQVYRSTKSGAQYERLTDAIIRRTTFSDETVRQGMTYFYAVTAVDKTGNESSRSPEQKTYTEKVR